MIGVLPCDIRISSGIGDILNNSIKSQWEVAVRKEGIAYSI